MTGRTLRGELTRLRESIANVPAVRRIFSALMVIGSAYFVVVLATAARELLIAREFGVSDALDAFLIAYAVPVFVIAVMTPTFQSAIVPTFIRVREHSGHEAARQMFSDVMALLLVTVILVAVLLAVIYPLLLPFVARSFPPPKLALTRALFFHLLPVIIIAGLNGAMIATLNATHRFVVAGLIPAVTPLVVATVLVLGHGHVDVFDLAHAVVAGAVLESMLLIAQLARTQLLPSRPRRQLTPELRTIIGQYMALVAGSATMSMTTVVDQLMAASLGSGASSSLSYGAKVVNFGTGVASVVVGTAVMPFFSSMVAKEDWRGLRETLRTNILIVILATIPVTILFIVFSEPLVRLLFQRGHFRAADTAVVAQIQRCFALQIPFYAANIPLVRAISALRSNHILTIEAAVNLTCNIVLNVVFMHYMGVAGIALSTACVYLISFVYSLVMLRRLLASVSASAAG